MSVDIDGRVNYEDWVPAIDRAAFHRLEQSLGKLEEQPSLRAAASTLFWQIYFDWHKGMDIAKLNHRIYALYSTIDSSKSTDIQEAMDEAYVQIHLTTILLRMIRTGMWGTHELCDELVSAGQRSFKVLPYAWYHGPFFSTRILNIINNTVKIHNMSVASRQYQTNIAEDILDQDPDDNEKRIDSLAAVLALFHREVFEFWRASTNNKEDALNHFSLATILWDYSQSGITGELHLTHAADCFENILATRYLVTSWEAIADSCDLICLAMSSQFPLSEDLAPDTSIKDGSGNEWDAIRYWQNAATLAANKLTLDDLVKFRHKEKEDLCEDRLHRDFFEDCWNQIPEKARAALIETETNWSRQETGRKASMVIINLQVAMEICTRELLIRPLTQKLLRGTAIQVRRNGSSTLYPSQITANDLNLREICKVLKSREFKTILHKLAQEDTDFVQEALASECNSLWHDRNPEVHPPYKNDVEKMKKHRKAILGIGQEGILVKLIKVHNRIENIPI